MRTHRIGLVVAMTFAMMMLASAAFAADATATGTWKWTAPGRGGNPGRDTVLTLKQDGEKLTGTVKMGQNDVAIEKGTIKAGELSFTVTREMNGNKFTSTYKGKLDGDTIKGKIESERNGQPQSRDWEAKREKA